MFKKISLFSACLLILTLFSCDIYVKSNSETDKKPTGRITIELPDIPEISALSVLPGPEDVAKYVLLIENAAIGYKNTIESKTGGLIFIDSLEEGKYSISVNAYGSAEELIMSGSNVANVYVGEVTYVQIQLQYIYGYINIEIKFPESDYYCEMELNGIQLDINIPIKVINGPEILIERLGHSGSYDPGFSDTGIFSIETSSTNASSLKSWFDGFADPRSGSLIVRNSFGDEAYRWNMYELTPVDYVDDTDGTTHFIMSADFYEIDGSSVLDLDYDAETDKGIEISGVAQMAAIAIEDVDESTLTLVFGYEEGVFETYTWIDNFVSGVFDIRSISVITYGPGGLGDEISRRNYFECFPMSYKQIGGFNVDEKGKYRLVISFDFAEEAL